MVRELEHGVHIDDPLQKSALDRLVQSIAAVLATSGISVALLDLDSGDLVTQAERVNDARLARPARIQLHQGIEGWVGAHLTPISIEDVAADAANSPRFAGDIPPGARSLLCLPLVYEQHLLGTVFITSGEPYAFTRGRAALIQLSVDQTATTIGMATFAEGAKHNLRVAERLLDAALALGSTLDQERLLPYIVASIRRALPCDDAFVYAYEASAGALHLLTGLGESAERAIGLKVSVKDPRSLAAWVVRQQRGRVTMPAHSETDEAFEAALGPSEKALLAGPLVSRNQLRGVVVLARAQAFSAAELQMVSRLSSLIAGALENVERFHEEQARQEQLAAMFAASTDGMALIESDMKVIEANDAFAGSVGLYTPDVLGSDVCTLLKRYAPGMCNLCEGKCLIAQTIETGEAVPNVECEMVSVERSASQPGTRVSGGWLPRRYIEYSLTPMDGPYGRRVLLVGHDVTDKHEIDKTKAQFFSMVSHELRTPLQAISGFLDLTLAGMAGDLSNEQADFLRRARASSEHLTTLVDDLLLISRTDAGQFTLHRTATDLGVLIREVIEEMELVAEDAGVRLRADVPDNLPLAYLDGQRITQVLRNLVTNAVKFTPDDGEVTLSATTLNDQLVLRVHDTGIGIGPEHLDHIFDRFYQVNGATSTGRYQGQGLGLAIVRIIVEGHRGTVQVDSAPGRGSTFTVLLPRARSEGREP